VVILGGGVAGLAASILARAPVYEAENQIGGVAASDSCDGFTFDRGIHILQTKNAKILKLLSDVGVQLAERSRRAFIFSHDTYSAYPFQVNTATLPLALRARCVWSFLRRDAEAKPCNYEDWMYANLGRGFAETFLIPYSEKFWTVHPREMTHEWTGNRVPRPSTFQVLRGALWSKQTRIGTNVDFRYPESAPGYGAIPDALACKAGPIYLSHRACRLDVRRQEVHFDNGARIGYKSLISTIPLPELVNLCPDAPADIRSAAAKLRTNSIVVVNLGIGRKALSDWHWAHFPEKDISFFRISFPHNFAGNVSPPGTSSISAELAYAPDRPVDQANIVAKVVEDLIRVRVLKREDPILVSTTRNVRYAYCIYDFERKEAVRAIRDWLAKWQIIPAGRYGLWSYFWSDEAMASGMQAAAKAKKGRADAELDELLE
jgi:protoporphyrinogen oxidase